MWYAGQGVGHDEQRQSRTVPKKNRNRNRREGTGTGSEACWVVTVYSRAEIGTINLHRASKLLVFTRRGRLELPAPVVRALKIGNSADIPNGLL